MSLFHACVVRRSRDRYRLQQLIVHLCACSQGTALAEIIITRMGQGFVTSGVGCSHYLAGRSVLLGPRSIQQRPDYFRWIRANTPMMENVDIEVARVNAVADEPGDDDKQGSQPDSRSMG